MAKSLPLKLEIMKRIIFTILTLLIFKVQAQLNLKFDKRYVECEDKWVAIKMNEDNTYNLGFIYIDAQAGLTIHSAGTFKLLKDGTFNIERNEKYSLKARLEPNNVKVAIIPDSLFNKLQISEIPDWLKHYKTDLNTVERQFKWGYMYNGWNECERALPFLLKAKEINPDFKDLAVEIAFSYNCLKNYEKAIEILEVEVIKQPGNAYVNKEFIYSVSKSDNIEKATKQFYQSSKTIKENPYNAENCYNIMQYYYNQKDTKNFMIWYDELTNWPINNEQIKKYADEMKNDLK